MQNIGEFGNLSTNSSSFFFLAFVIIQSSICSREMNETCYPKNSYIACLLT